MKAAKLVESAREAADVRAHQTDPNVVALRIERTRALVDRLIWAGIVLGLLFTMANVQSFASHGSKFGSVEWCIAWLLDPTVSLVLIGVLKGEQVINRAGLEAGTWVRVTKWVTLACTYAMNTWSAYAAGDPAKILLHSVPPLIVVVSTEAVTDLRLSITAAVDAAYRLAAGHVSDTPADTTEAVSNSAQDTASNTVPDTIADTIPDTVPTRSDTVSNTTENTVPDTTDDTVDDTAPTRSRTAKRTAAKRRGAPVSRNELARQIYDTHMDEHGAEPAIAELMRQLKDAGHPTGNKTAAGLLDDIRRNPLRIAN